MSFWRGASARPPRRCLRENAGRRWTSTRSAVRCGAAGGGARRRRARAAAALSAWHLAVTRAQQTAPGDAGAAAATRRAAPPPPLRRRRGGSRRRTRSSGGSWSGRGWRPTPSPGRDKKKLRCKKKPRLKKPRSTSGGAGQRLEGARGPDRGAERERAARRGARGRIRLLRVRVGGESGETWSRRAAPPAAAGGEAAACGARSGDATRRAAAARRRVLPAVGRRRWGRARARRRRRDVGLSTGRGESPDRDAPSTLRHRSGRSSRVRRRAGGPGRRGDDEAFDEPNDLRDVRAYSPAASRAGPTLSGRGSWVVRNVPVLDAPLRKRPRAVRLPSGPWIEPCACSGWRGPGRGTGCADRICRQVAEEKRRARRPKPARASFAVLDARAPGGGAASLRRG